jgi:hypothetical protein
MRRRDVGRDRCRAGERMPRSGRYTGNTQAAGQKSRQGLVTRPPPRGLSLAPALAQTTARGAPTGSPIN